MEIVLMMKKTLTSGVALSVLLNLSLAQAKNSEEFENIKFTHICPGIVMTESQLAIAPLEEANFLKEYGEKVRRYAQPTSLERGYDLTRASVVTTAKIAFNVGLWGVDKTFRYGAAYLASYYGEEAVVQGISLAARGATTLVTGNPVAGKAIGDGIVGIYKLAQYIPGSRGAVACLATPFTKIATDLTIDYGPYVATQTAKAGYRVAKTGYNLASGTASAVSNLSKWFARSSRI